MIEAYTILNVASPAAAGVLGFENSAVRTIRASCPRRRAGDDVSRHNMMRSVLNEGTGAGAKAPAHA
jgi:hypothetical protein